MMDRRQVVATAVALAIHGSAPAAIINMAGPQLFTSGSAGITTPGAPVVVASGPTTNYMRWSASTVSTGELFYQYRIYRSAHGADSYSLVGVSPVPAFVDSGLSNSTQYDYKVDCQDELLNTSSLSPVCTWATGATTTKASGARADYATWLTTVINTRYALPVGGQTWAATQDGNQAGTGTLNATGCGFQYALTNCSRGDVIVLTAGQTYTANNAPSNQYQLPNKTTGSGWIYITTSAYSSLPPPGTRVGPSDSSNMPKILCGTVAPGGVGIYALATAHHYRFVGIHIAGPTGADFNRAVDLDAVATSLANQPHDITFDRCLIRADATRQSAHGFSVGCNSFALIDSYGDGWYSNGSVYGDCQVVYFDACSGPTKIDNCYLDASGENFIYGGNDPAITNVIPSDNQITNNYIYKNLAWRNTSDGLQVKNLGEIKNGQRTLIAHNRFENMWSSGQTQALALKSTNQAGGGTWCICSDTAVIYNRFVNVAQGVKVSQKDGSFSSPPTTRATVRDNIIEANGLDRSGGNSAGARILEILDFPVDTIMENNTGIIYGGTGGNSGIYFGNSPGGQTIKGVISNNIVSYGDYGAPKGSPGEGTTALNGQFGTWEFLENVIIGSFTLGNYPATTNQAANNSAVSFAGGALSTPPSNVSDYALSGGSYVSAGSDGFNIGADVAGVAT